MLPPAGTTLKFLIYNKVGESVQCVQSGVVFRRLQTRGQSATDKNGQKRTKTDFYGHEIIAPSQRGRHDNNSGTQPPVAFRAGLYQPVNQSKRQFRLIIKLPPGRCVRLFRNRTDKQSDDFFQHGNILRWRVIWYSICKAG